MKLIINKTKEELGKASAIHAAKLVNEAIAKQGYARILLSTGASQFPFFVEFVKQNIDWSSLFITFGFKDDEVGIDMQKIGEFFLDDYEGYTGGEKIK
jgi:glucosamine-6-phosphate deaminase